MLAKYVNRKVVVIYQDGKGQITKRDVVVRSVNGGRAEVYDLDKRAHRTLRLDRILAAWPMTGRRAG